MALEIKDLSVEVEGKRIVSGVSLRINPGEIHVIMGPNGSGKSTLAGAVMGLSKYKAAGSVLLDGKEQLGFPIDVRSRNGIFLAFQNPPEIEFIANSALARQAVIARSPQDSADTFRERFVKCLSDAGLGEGFYGRPANYGFSGGEKKKNEISHLLMLRPKFALLDEIDSGLDVDSMKEVSRIIRRLASEGMGIVLITHNPSLVWLFEDCTVHVMRDGKISRTGNVSIIGQLEKEGFNGEK